LIYSADIGSIFFQIIIFWLISTFFSKKKKNGKNKKVSQLQTIIKGFVNKISDKIESSINELEIVTDESTHFQKDDKPKTNEQTKQKKQQVIRRKKNNEISSKPKTQRKNRLGLNSRSTLKKVIILNEIIGKPVSLRR